MLNDKDLLRLQKNVTFDTFARFFTNLNDFLQFEILDKWYKMF